MAARGRQQAARAAGTELYSRAVRHCLQSHCVLLPARQSGDCLQQNYRKANNTIFAHCNMLAKATPRGNVRVFPHAVIARAFRAPTIATARKIC